MKPAAPPSPLISFEQAELETLRAGAKLSFREKIQWIENAQRLSEKLQHSRVRYPRHNETESSMRPNDAPPA